MYPSFIGIPLPVVYSVELFQITDQISLAISCLSQLCRMGRHSYSSIETSLAIKHKASEFESQHGCIFNQLEKLIFV